MKRLIILILTLISFTLGAVEVNDILDAFEQAIVIPNLSGNFSIKLISTSGEVRELKASAYQKLSNTDQMNRLFVFNHPPSVRDTSLLVHSYYNNDENKMWIYLPVVKKIKRIALENSGGGYFMGSDFSYRDFISKSTSEYTYEFLGEKNIDGRDCYMIKEYGTTPKLKEALGYQHVINYYGKDDSFLYARDYYEFSGDLLKTYRVKNTLIFDKYIYPTEIEMTNKQNGHKSVINVTDINLDELPDSYFTTRNLKKK